MTENKSRFVHALKSHDSSDNLITKTFCAVLAENQPEDIRVVADRRKFRYSQNPTVLVGKDSVELDYLLKHDKHFFVLIDTGKSSKKVLDRANIIVNYMYKPETTILAWQRYAKIKTPILFSPTFYPYEKTVYSTVTDGVVFDIDAGNRIFLKIVFEFLEQHNVPVFPARYTGSMPRFVVTDKNEVAMQAYMDGIPVLHVPNKQYHVYTYLTTFFTLPWSVDNLNSLLYDKDFYWVVVEKITESRKRFKDSGVLLTTSIGVIYEDFCQHR